MSNINKHAGMYRWWDRHSVMVRLTFRLMQSKRQAVGMCKIQACTKGGIVRAKMNCPFKASREARQAMPCRHAPRVVSIENTPFQASRETGQALPYRHAHRGRIIGADDTAFQSLERCQTDDAFQACQDGKRYDHGYQTHTKPHHLLRDMAESHRGKGMLI